MKKKIIFAENLNSMRINLFFYGLLISLFISCSDKKEPEAKREVEVFSNTFNVIVDATVKKDDKLMLYFQDETIGWFDDEHFVEQSVVGKGGDQKIVFSVPEGVIPTNIRLDISSVQGQEPIVIKNIILKYRDRNFVIDQANFANYFEPNDYIDFDYVSNTAKVLSKADKTYDPILLPKEIMAREIANLTKK